MRTRFQLPDGSDMGIPAIRASKRAVYIVSSAVWSIYDSGNLLALPVFPESFGKHGHVGDGVSEPLEEGCLVPSPGADWR